jgi:hypothetical protein
MTQTSVITEDFVSPMPPALRSLDLDEVFSPSPIAFTPRVECICADADPSWENGTVH